MEMDPVNPSILSSPHLSPSTVVLEREDWRPEPVYWVLGAGKLPPMMRGVESWEEGIEEGKMGVVVGSIAKPTAMVAFGRDAWFC